MQSQVRLINSLSLIPVNNEAQNTPWWYKEANRVIEKQGLVYHHEHNFDQPEDKREQTLTGMANAFCAEYAFHEQGREEESVLMNGCLV